MPNTAALQDGHRATFEGLSQLGPPNPIECAASVRTSEDLAVRVDWLVYVCTGMRVAMKKPESTPNVKRLDGTLSPESAEFYEHFFSRHQMSLYRFVRRLGVADEVARDLVQDVYLRLIRQNEPARLAKSPRGYIYRIAVNLLRDNLRRERLHTKVVTESISYPAELSLVHTPEHILLDKERVGLLQAAIHKLEPQERQILLLHRLHNMSCHEIAAELGIPRRTVERRLATALDFCRSQVWKPG